MAGEENNDEITPAQRKSRVLVAMNYVLIAVILLGIGMVLFKKPAANGLVVTGSAPVDAWCQTHTAKADCEKICEGQSFDAYTSCTDACLKRLDECKSNK